MDIKAIKSRLSIQSVLIHYGYKADGNGRLCCPFHEDKTPSMQVYEATNTYTCFSSNCTAGSGDAIDFIQHSEKCTKHEALLKATEMVNSAVVIPPQWAQPVQHQDFTDEEKMNLLTKSFGFFSNAMKQIDDAKKYVEQRKLHGKGSLIEVGYNGARYHYRGGMDEREMALWEAMGMMKPIGNDRNGVPSNNYRSWGKDCLIFPLKNKREQIVSFYGRSVINEDKQKHYYLKDRTGLYPNYPKTGTKILILTESVIDTASLIATGIPDAQTAVLACYGTNGLTAEHLQAIQDCATLSEIIFFFDGDQAGILAVEKHSKQLRSLYKNLIISQINTPEGEDINSLHQGHERGIFEHLIEHRSILAIAENSPLLSSMEKPVYPIQSLNSQIDTNNPEHIIYQTPELFVHIWGGIDNHNLSKLKVSLHLSMKADKAKSFRDEANLYSYAQIKRSTQHISESLGVSSTYIGEVLADLTSKLESYRLSQKAQIQSKNQEEKVTLNSQEKKEALALLTSPNLLRKTLTLIEESGLVGQQKNGMLLFLLYLSRLMDEPLHAIVLGKSGSGKTYLQTKIADCIPPEDLRVVTSLTENTLYYSPKGFWQHKVLMIEDLEGVYQAFFPLREMMSKQEISKFTTDKDSQGNNVQIHLKVEGPVCVSGATTKEWIYEDNANRSYLLLIDESPEHLEQVMEYQRKEFAGQINKIGQMQAKSQLQNAQRILKKVKVINPYASELVLPEKLFKKLRTNGHYLKLIQIISYYGQYNRPIKTDNTGESYVETNIEDIAWANRLIKESLLIKSDELSGNLRQFFEILKAQMIAKEENQRSFFAKDIRQMLRLNPMTVNRHLRDLEQRGYISQIGGNRKTGYEYQVELWQEYSDLQNSINIMDANLEELRKKEKTASVTQV
jgi:DNA primase